MSEPSVGLILEDIITAVGILVGAVLVAWLVHAFLIRVVRRLVKWNETSLDDMVLRAARVPLCVAIVLAGIYFSSTSLPLPPSLAQLLGKGVFAALMAVVVYLAVNIIDAVLKWYGVEVATKTIGGLDNKVIPLLRWLVRATGGFLGLILVLELAGIHVPAVTSWLAQHGSRVALITIPSFVVFFTLSHAVTAVVKRTVVRGMPGQSEEEIAKSADTLSNVFVTTGQIVILVIVTFMLLSEVGIDIAPALAGVGVAGIAIGFGAQTLVRDIISGFFIILENQYRLGDVVRVANIAGQVEEINLRRTVLRDLDGVVHHVPNGEIRVASNFTKEWSRVNLNVSVAYGEDLDRAIAVINRVGEELASDPEWAPLLLSTPQVLRVDNLGDSGIDIKILGETKPIQQWAVMGELRKRIKKAFDEEEIEIPWPHTKVYFGNAPPQGVPARRERVSEVLPTPEPQEPRVKEEPVLPPED